MKKLDSEERAGRNILEESCCWGMRDSFLVTKLVPCVTGRGHTSVIMFGGFSPFVFLKKDFSKQEAILRWRAAAGGSDGAFVCRCQSVSVLNMYRYNHLDPERWRVELVKALLIERKDRR